jgi:hypothetical protein
MLLRRSRHVVRRTAALLAWAALLAMPVQSALACPMAAETAVDGTTALSGAQADAEHAGHASHAAHLADGDAASERESNDAPVPPCEDLAHCAVAAVPSAAEDEAAVSPATLRADRPFADAPLAPALALEPPPPKR